MKNALLLFVLLAIGTGGFAQSDEKAILSSIEIETRAYHDAKPELEMSMWHLAPYNEHQGTGWVSITGRPYSHGAQFKNYAETGLKQNKPTGLTPSLSDVDVQVRGNVAWATLTETHTDGANIPVRKSRQTRILEKKDGQWKHVLVATQHETPTMTESGFMDFIKAWEKEPTATFERAMAPDFLFIGHDGKTYDPAKLLGLITGTRYSSINVENLKVRNFGNTAVATGSITANYAQTASPYTHTKDAFTYTFQNQGGHWKFLSASHVKLDYGMKK